MHVHGVCLCMLCISPQFNVAIHIVAASSSSQTVSGLLNGLESSAWIKHIHLILEVAIFAAKVYLLTTAYCGTDTCTGHCTVNY